MITETYSDRVVILAEADIITYPVITETYSYPYERVIILFIITYPVMTETYRCADDRCALIKIIIYADIKLSISESITLQSGILETMNLELSSRFLYFAISASTSIISYVTACGAGARMEADMKYVK